jgi:PPOX class probable F420-dependent enzyme
MVRSQGIWVFRASSFSEGNALAAVDSCVVDRTLAHDRVAAARIGRLATVTPEGRPHIVPCCFFLDDPTVYSAVDGKPKSTLALRRLENLAANPECTLLVDHYAEDWTTLWWIRIDGVGRVLHDGPERQRALGLLTTKFEQYRESPPPGAVVALDIESWRMWP